MFLDQVTTELRQGDICYSWAFPKWQINGYQIVSEAGTTKPSRSVVGLISPEEIPLVICSHDCDLENPRGRLGILVAPLLSWPIPDQGSDKSLELVSSMQIQDGAFSFINLFPLALPEDGQKVWRVADFSGITSAGSAEKAVPLLKKAKALEMTEDSRALFKQKLAAFLGRS